MSGKVYIELNKLDRTTMKYKIRKQESNKDFWFYVGFYLVVGIAIGLFMWFILWISFEIMGSYNEALNTCIDKGYSLEYCKNMLN